MAASKCSALPRQPRPYSPLDFNSQQHQHLKPRKTFDAMPISQMALREEGVLHHMEKSRIVHGASAVAEQNLDAVYRTPFLASRCTLPNYCTRCCCWRSRAMSAKPILLDVDGKAKPFGFELNTRWRHWKARYEGRKMKGHTASCQSAQASHLKLSSDTSVNPHSPSCDLASAAHRCSRLHLEPFQANLTILLLHTTIFRQHKSSSTGRWRRLAESHSWIK